MSGSEENEPVSSDETEIVEEADRPVDEAPVKPDATEVVPLSVPRDEGRHLNLSEESEGKD
jgi:hypothetical protein